MLRLVEQRPLIDHMACEASGRAAHSIATRELLLARRRRLNQRQRDGIVALSGSGDVVGAKPLHRVDIQSDRNRLHAQHIAEAAFPAGKDNRSFRIMSFQRVDQVANTNAGESRRTRRTVCLLHIFPLTQRRLVGVHHCDVDHTTPPSCPAPPV